MARKRKPGEAPSYEGKPAAPATAETAARVALVQAVLANEMTISEAAERAGIARVNMQTLVHRAERAMQEALAPRSTGPMPKPLRERELETENAALKVRLAKLEEQLQAADAVMGAAGEIIRHLRGLPPKPTKPLKPSSSGRSKRSSGPSTTVATAEEPDPEPEPAASAAAALTRIAMTPERALAPMAARVGLRGRCLRSWLGRLARGEPLRRPRGGRARLPEPEVERRLRAEVRTLGGLVGAESLVHSVGGAVSRRVAGVIKRDELASMERERKQSSAVVEVLVPGVVRGFDAMYIGHWFALLAGDACAPYRTSAVRVAAYDAVSVAAVLDADFERHGAPLALRADWARCHRAPPVLSVLERHGVLLLQGPTYYPGYNGQLERQNREHRAWLGAVAGGTEVDDTLLARMVAGLNGHWRRPTLAWRTAEEVWMSRPPLNEDRVALRAEVAERAARLVEHGVAGALADRLAIEQMLTKRGYLRITRGEERYV